MENTCSFSDSQFPFKMLLQEKSQSQEHWLLATKHPLTDKAKQSQSFQALYSQARAITDWPGFYMTLVLELFNVLMFLTTSEHRLYLDWFVHVSCTERP